MRELYQDVLPFLYLRISKNNTLSQKAYSRNAHKTGVWRLPKLDGRSADPETPQLRTVQFPRVYGPLPLLEGLVCTLTEKVPMISGGGGDIFEEPRT